ncbi:MAG: polysaccharide biosynthesis/export family protein [Verrucomicrobiales bacterium]|nr:polysaccharide biosynthesis/export family protein [Verrucomicrobiales bacterium]
MSTNFPVLPRLLGIAAACSQLACLAELRAQANASGNRMEVRRAAPAEATATPAGPESGSGTDNYRLRANDEINVQVFQEPDLSGKVRVREDGTVRLPLINETVRVGGLNATEVENRIRALLARDYVRDPRVTVNVSEQAKVNISVRGQVNHAGTYPFPSNRPVTLLQAVSAAGSETRLGNVKKVRLTRVSGGRAIVREFDLRDPSAATVYLRDGDVIEVPERSF